VSIVSFVRKHWLLVLVNIELVTAAALSGWLLAGVALSAG
jgi:hypothetical protein